MGRLEKRPENQRSRNDLSRSAEKRPLGHGGGFRKSPTECSTSFTG